MDTTDTSFVLTIPRKEFVSEWLKYGSKDKNKYLLIYVLKLGNVDEDKITNLGRINYAIKDYSKKISDRWEKCHRKADVFFKEFSAWLEGKGFEFEFVMSQVTKQSTSQGAGRPEKCFTDSSYKTKKRKISNLLKTDCERLTFAAQVSLHASGNRIAAKNLKEMLGPSSSKSDISKTDISVRSLSPDEALALFIDCKLTKNSYCLLRENALMTGHHLYPPYYKIQNAKKACCVSETNMIISETRAELSMQAILDLTSERLCQAQYPVIKQLIDAGKNNFTLFSKWGCDGSGGHSRYKQKFSESSMSDEYLFMFSFVPIHLCSTDSQHYVWQNGAPGSTKFCRPIKFIFEKETTQCILSETEVVKTQIQALTPSKVFIDGKEVFIKHQLALTMVDGKVANALTNTKSTQTYFICQATPKHLKGNLPLPPDIVENYSFGLSTLHAWIRTFEFLLNLSYRLEVGKKRLITEEDERSKDIKKSKVQGEFKIQLGLDVDKPKQGSGNTNDGNMARRFFENSIISSSITGINENLITRFRVILQTLSSGYEIDVDKFEKYAAETKNILINLYPWFEMSPTVHKILEHSGQIIRHHLVPIGMLSEEAQEARNKDSRRFRVHNTRKCSREATNKDLLMMLLVSSDPIVASLRKIWRKKTTKPFDVDVISLLKCSLPYDQLRELTLENEDDDTDSSEENAEGCSSIESDDY